mmetsp:Transcript_21577/g.62030  ORF Transcript_21577/g.62030 Transcript_21577/m.62030 type:complete len:418 (-) Transcript_21577:1108-2361(-)
MPAAASSGPTAPFGTDERRSPLPGKVSPWIEARAARRGRGSSAAGSLRRARGQTGRARPSRRSGGEQRRRWSAPDPAPTARRAVVPAMRSRRSTSGLRRAPAARQRVRPGLGRLSRRRRPGRPLRWNERALGRPSRRRKSSRRRRTRSAATTDVLVTRPMAATARATPLKLSVPARRPRSSARRPLTTQRPRRGAMPASSAHATPSRRSVRSGRPPSSARVPRKRRPPPRPPRPRPPRPPPPHPWVRPPLIGHGAPSRTSGRGRPKPSRVRALGPHKRRVVETAPNRRPPPLPPSPPPPQVPPAWTARGRRSRLRRPGRLRPWSVPAPRPKQRRPASGARAALAGASSELEAGGSLGIAEASGAASLAAWAAALQRPATMGDTWASIRTTRWTMRSWTTSSCRGIASACLGSRRGRS